MPKRTANVAASLNKANCKVGRQYSKCVPGELCEPVYLVDTVSECFKCKKLKTC
jgi:hypothetical protein